MADLMMSLVMALILFTLLVAAIYIGTTLALRSFFGGEEFRPSDMVGFGDDSEER